MKLETIIGLEIHTQLKTKSKMFCSCARVAETAPANSSICPICMGHPGTLPVPNMEAVRLGMKAALAMKGNIYEQTKFDRKNYFYPDLPKGYQISQYDKPLSQGGELVVEVPDNSIASRKVIRVEFERLHLEEDAAKNTHGTSGESFVDFNRGGTPLAEIVTRPDMRSPEEARAFLQELRRILRELDISDADMEKGNLRCDANVSMRPIDENGVPISLTLHPKTEVKNINSFRSLERAIYFEIDRQSELWATNTPPAQSSTRGWNDEKGITELQRVKEGAADYRYFPEPDIPPLDLTSMLASVKRHVVELPAEKRARFMAEYFVSEADARIITDSKELSNYFEQVVSETNEWLDRPFDSRASKLVTGWMLSKLAGLMKVKGVDWATLKITAENFAEFVKIIDHEETTGANALKILEIMLENGEDPSQIMEERGLGRVSDEAMIQKLVEMVIESNPKQAAEFRAGKEPILKFLIGMVMKASEGKADPVITEKLMRATLGK
ncbi:MAG: Asp-tRNA(Asn)/Glu-tRNA(Gln) amidotransferase subunit GatB [bacterium]